MTLVIFLIAVPSGVIFVLAVWNAAEWSDRRRRAKVLSREMAKTRRWDGR